MRKNSLKGMIQELCSRYIPEIVPAQVTKEYPLRLKMLNETDMEIAGESVIIPSTKKNLTVGENVYLLVLKNKGEIFYLLDRM
ncbi:hypothetical protein [Parablautia sp. Marseille-Q6255]|uniref:hypothetical protein n=1 Tax=Parablautia sp. Marseille-Q6255 TaxID=3039593 RepID=UPI0024BC6B27|nr:hypothetical protein [Parablautia sp. Marseille-Q6255]